MNVIYVYWVGCVPKIIGGDRSSVLHKRECDAVHLGYHGLNDMFLFDKIRSLHRLDPAWRKVKVVKEEHIGHLGSATPRAICVSTDLVNVHEHIIFVANPRVAQGQHLDFEDVLKVTNIRVCQVNRKPLVTCVLDDGISAVDE